MSQGYQVLWSPVSIRFIAHWSRVREKKYCPIVHKNSENPKFQATINLCNQWHKSLLYASIRIVNNFMNNHEHFEQRGITAEINYRNKHNAQLASASIASQIRKMTCHDCSRFFRACSWNVHKTVRFPAWKSRLLDGQIKLTIS